MVKVANMDSAKITAGLRGALVIAFATCFLLSIATAQLGEIAGELAFSVQVGHSETLQMHLLNAGGQPISVQMVPPAHLQLTSNASLTGNQTYPTYMVNPINLTIPPHGESAVNVTIYMPLNDMPNFATWEGILSAQEVSNVSNPGGAVVIEGVAKGFSIGVIASTTTTTTAPPTTVPALLFLESEYLPYVPVVIVALAIIIGLAYYFMVFSKKPKPKYSKKMRKLTAEDKDLKSEVAQLRAELQRMKQDRGAPARRAKRLRAKPARKTKKPASRKAMRARTTRTRSRRRR